MNKKKRKLTFNMALFIIWLLIFAAISIKSPAFLSSYDLINVMLRNIVEIGMVALPMTLIIIAGGIDLSVGNIMVLAAMLGGMAAQYGGNLEGIAVTLATGILCGLINGFMIAKAKISPMVPTLTTMYLFLGLARGISHGDSIYAYDFASFLGNTKIAGLPIQIWIYVILAVIFIILLGITTFGRKLYAIGLNPNAFHYAGIPTEKIKIIIYVICGSVCALAAFIWLGRFTSIKYDVGTNFNLKIITVVVLGGTSINGGVVDMKGTVIGTLIMATLNSGLTVLNIPIDVQTIEFDIRVDEEAMDIMIPKLTLQPFVENAIRYSLMEQETVIVQLYVLVFHNLLFIEIKDNGCGISEEKAKEIQQKIQLFRHREEMESQQVSFGGLGLVGIMVRFEIYYVDNFKYAIQCNNDTGGASIQFGTDISEYK